jgi:serine/threonine protein kinase
MEAPQPRPRPSPRIDWESFYTNYRKPGYVPGYEIVNKLGGGVFGMVFKARKESIGKDYAIKFLKVDDEVVRDAVLREIDSVRFFAQVDHPNLVAIEDKGEVDGIPFIIMSYAGDETLRKRLETGSLSREEALRIFVQAARGVQALHEHSLVHFDLKPANIFLKGEIARVGDYGLSKLVTESRNSLSFGRGTPYYMAPEMLQRRGDHRSDVYSLGVVLFECLTGDVPFRGDSEWEVLRKHENEAPAFPPSLQEPERSVLARCLAKQPADRWQSVAELLHVLQAPASLGESFVLPRARPAAQRPPAPAPATPAAPEWPPEPFPPAAPGRPPQGSPYGMPWHADPTGHRGGWIAGVVHLTFRLFELLIHVALLPVRGLAVGAGRLIVFTFELPFRLLGLTMRLTGYVLVALILLAMLLGVITLVMSVL